MSEEREPIDTSTPWHRPRHEPQSRVEFERSAHERAARAAQAAYDVMTKPGEGRIHKMSLVTPTYEPNRAMAPNTSDLVQSNEVPFISKVVVISVLACILGIVGISVYLFVSLG